MWKQLFDAPSYEVSTTGQVRGKRGLLKPMFHKQGYPYVFIYVDGKRHYKLIHKLVMETFVGCPLPGFEIRHKDDDPSNCCLDNLEYGTRLENMRDKYRTGSQAKKLNPRKVRIIRGLIKCGFTYSRLSEIFGVNRQTIYRVNRRLRWAHID